MSLVEDELVAHAVRDGEQVKISGPDVSLQAPLAERMSLAVHELATTAVKHGALAANGGKVLISWKLQHPSNGRMLLFKWQESGMNLDEEPQHEGFGMELLRRSLPYDLRAETEVELHPDGLYFELRLPLNGSAAT